MKKRVLIAVAVVLFTVIGVMSIATPSVQAVDCWAQFSACAADCGTNMDCVAFCNWELGHCLEMKPPVA